MAESSQESTFERAEGSAPSSGFQLFSSADTPRWRSPQIGSLGALVSHWSLPQPTPALVSLPTGTGKTAVALAARRIAAAKSVLVVVPSVDLREQMVEAFAREELLVRIGALSGATSPCVHEAKGLADSWEPWQEADVVIGIPTSVSPARYPDQPPPADLFDLIIIDEAHHAPAPTWRAILDHFSGAKSVLLTATPRRRDGQRIPGTHIYHYPLRQALEERIFKPIQPILLDIPLPATRAGADGLIATQIVTLKETPEHATSTLMVRAATRARATELAELYSSLGLKIDVVHSNMSRQAVSDIVAALRAGDSPGVAVVGMLVEGFDLPSLRLLAYHDKHKSLPATAQIIGRLARVDDKYPQDSVLVTVRDIDIFPQIQGVVRDLYSEDADWATVLPGIIDDEISAARANKEYTRAFRPPAPSGEVAPEDLAPVRRTVTFEVKATTGLARRGFFNEIPDAVRPGQVLRGETVLYSSLNPDSTTLIIVTQKLIRPRWHVGPALDSAQFSLHLLSWRPAPRTDIPSLLLVNADNGALVADLLELLDPDQERSVASPSQLQDAFDSLDRISVSSVGLRNSYGGQMGQASYKMVAGKGVDRGMRESDTSFGALGHAMVQIQGNSGAFTAGVATGKGKYWETRYSTLLDYNEFLTDFAERYWFPPAAAGGPLLPQVSRGTRLEEWPASMPLAAEVDGALMGTGWTTENGIELDSLELVAEPAIPDSSGRLTRIRLILTDPRTNEILWTGWQDLLGIVTSDGPEVLVRRGYAGSSNLEDLFSARPPTIFFSDGRTVIGTTIVESRTVSYEVPSVKIETPDWSGTDLQAETRRHAAARANGRSVHEQFEMYLVRQARRGRRRWILLNDGPGEFADYLLIEVSPQRVWIDLWHAKAAGGPNPSVRVTDLQEVIAQAIKSRRWITDPEFWEELDRRLTGVRSPAATLVEGRLSALRILCGHGDRSVAFNKTRPVVTGRIGIVQPGLSLAALSTALLSRSSLSAKQSRDLLAVFHDSASQICETQVICSE